LLQECFEQEQLARVEYEQGLQTLIMDLKSTLQIAVQYTHVVDQPAKISPRENQEQQLYGINDSFQIID